MSALFERIRAVLTPATPGPWTKRPNLCVARVARNDNRLVDYEHVAYLAGERGGANAELIAAAPGLLGEAAGRLDPGDTDIAELVARLRCDIARIEHDNLTHRAVSTPFSRDLTDAIRLLEQAFLTPRRPVE